MQQKKRNLKEIIREDIFDRMKMDQAIKILDRMDFDNIYDGAYKKRSLIYNDSQKFEKLSILDRHDNYLIKRMPNGEIELEVNGRVDYNLKKDDILKFNNALDNFKLMKESKKISQSKDKTLDFFTKNYTFNSEQDNKGNFIINGVKQNEEKTITKTVFDFFKNNDYINKFKNKKKRKIQKKNF